MSNSGSAVPQLTFRAVLLAIVLAVILSAANAYLGLFAGLTIATAIPALSFYNASKQQPSLRRLI